MEHHDYPDYPILEFDRSLSCVVGGTVPARQAPAHALPHPLQWAMLCRPQALSVTSMARRHVLVATLTCQELGVEFDALRLYERLGWQPVDVPMLSELPLGQGAAPPDLWICALSVEP